MEFISTAEAAKRKMCAPQSIWNAIQRGEINAHRIGRSYAVTVDKSFEDWEPDRVRQQIGKESQNKAV